MRLLVLILAGLLAMASPTRLAAQSTDSAPLPPPVPVHDLKSLAGKWEGKYTTRTGYSEAFSFLIRADGTFDVEPMGQQGALQLADGQLRLRNFTTGNRSTVTLYEAGGRRVLRGVADSSDFAWEVVQVAATASPLLRPRPAVGIGILVSSASKVWWEEALAARGYVDGRTIALEYRLGPPERMEILAAELAQLDVKIIIAGSTPAALAAKRATSTIPVVFMVGSDPVAAGLVDSLPRPGRNLTGFSVVSADVSAKRLQLLKEMVPTLTRAGVLANVSDPLAAAQLRELDVAARALSVQLQIFDIRVPADVEPAFAAMTAAAIGGVVVTSAPVMNQSDLFIVRLAATHRLPLIAESYAYPNLGGLMSYGPDFLDVMRQAASYVDRILKGARPADLPVELPTRFTLRINKRTALALGLTIPPAILARADEVIE